jgi:hypothetical protein
MLPDSHSPVKTPGQCFKASTYFTEQILFTLQSGQDLHLARMQLCIIHVLFILQSGHDANIPKQARVPRWQRETISPERRSSSPRAADVSPPWSGEPGAVPSKSCSVQRRPERQPRAAGVSPPWVDKPASAETGAIRQQTTDGVCGLPLHSRL